MTRVIEYNFKKVYCIPCGKFKAVPVDVNRCPVCETKFRNAMWSNIFLKK